MIKGDDDQAARTLVKIHEGFSTRLYRCTSGKLTIGYGHNIEDLGLPSEILETLFEYDFDLVYSEAIEIFPELETFESARRAAVLDMLFAMGKTRFLGFVNTIAAIRAGDWNRAGDEVIDSHWRRELDKYKKPGRETRAERDARLLRSGKFSLNMKF